MPRTWTRLWWVVKICCCVLAADSGLASAATPAVAPTISSSPANRIAPAEEPGGPWLGLNGNSSGLGGSYLGSIDEFAAHGVVYDRGNGIEWSAGQLPGEERSGEGLAASIDSGMIPVVTIEFAGYEKGACTWGHDCLPTGARAQSYAEGFVRSARAILARYPDRQILLEPINEPYGYGTAAQYGGILAQLLPRARQAGIPLEDIYAAAVGGRWVSDMYAARASLRNEIEGWYVHSYGPPSGSESEHGGGIEALPSIRAEMTSGQNNVIVSELGFCARDLPAGGECPDSSYTAGSSAQAAEWLTQALAGAAVYHAQGWLKAVLVYGRGAYQGWGMQLPGGSLTQQGRALQAFADLFGEASRLTAAPFSLGGGG